MQVPLSDGFHDAVVEPIHDAGKPAFSLRLLPRRPDPTGVGGPVPVSPASLSLPAREPLHHDPEVVRQLEDARRHGELVAVVGPSGAGKLRTAERSCAARALDDPLVVEPHLDPEWFVAARDAVTARRGLVHPAASTRHRTPRWARCSRCSRRVPRSCSPPTSTPPTTR